ncbi:hypothetical protein GCM10008927_30150 [Amylibacter ulvae]|uniref:Class I SAM-dependent methyltransferase n=2 Tax=Paramylibacter ulvae TaxID=1651968 RepID=A0ABQ3DAC8_9RHOB|nr:hypothetical protein GCM10008927_30150 [Amylibacter ulvae]
MLSLFAIHDLDTMISLDVPWWNYDAIDEVEKFLKSHPHSNVFEYGSGASTVWLSKRCGNVTSVEHHKNWHKMLIKRPDISDNINLVLREAKKVSLTNGIYSQKPGNKNMDFSDYVKEITKYENKFDLVIIDGRARDDCLKIALACLNPGALIVFDNSRRKRYQKRLNAISGRCERYNGLVPSLPYFDETTLIFPEIQ